MGSRGGINVDDVTIGGTAAQISPLHVIPLGLAEQVPVLTDGVTTTGNGTTGQPIVSLASAGTTIYFNVKAYGATGNGVTDDTTAIRNAIAAALAVGGGTVYFPNGTYLVSEHAGSFQCLSIPTGVSLLGQSTLGAIIFLAPSRASVRPVYVGIGTGTEHDPGATDLSIENLTVNGNKANQVISDSMHRDCVFLDACQRVYIRDVQCENGTGSGIVVWNDSTDIEIDHVYLHDNVWMGVAMGDAGGQERVAISNSYITNNAGGIHIEVSAACGDMLFDHNYMDATTGNYALEIVGAAGGVFVTHAVARANDINLGGVIIEYATDVVLEDNIITVSDTANFPARPLVIDGVTSDVWVTRNVFTLTSAAVNALEAIIVLDDPSDAGIDNVNIIDNTLYVNAPRSNGMVLQVSGGLNVSRNKIIGNSTMTPYSSFIVTATTPSTLTKTAHGLTTGQGPYYVTAPLGLPAGLINGNQAYYVIVTGANTFELATTYANAIAGTAVTFTTTGGGPITFNSALFGINLNTQTVRTMDRVSVDHNYVADFPVGVSTQTENTITKSNVIDISNNTFEAITPGIMGAAIGWEYDVRASVLQATCIGNQVIGNAVPTIVTYPAAPLLVGGNRNAGGQYNCKGSPSGVINDTQGSTAVQRDASTASTVFWINFGGGTAGWQSVTVP